MKITLISASFALAATAALADTEPLPAPMPASAPAPAHQVSWTGPYFGASIGQGTLDRSYYGHSSDNDLTEYGILGGYNFQIGGWVLGGELGFYPLNIKNYSYDGSIIHLRGRLGYAFGRFLPYVSYGASRLNIGEHADNGTSYGVGIDYLLGEHLVLGAEYSLDTFDDYDDIATMDLRIHMAQVLVSYQF